MFNMFAISIFILSTLHNVNRYIIWMSMHTYLYFIYFLLCISLGKIISTSETCAMMYVAVPKCINT